MEEKPAVLWGFNEDLLYVSSLCLSSGHLEYLHLFSIYYIFMYKDFPLDSLPIGNYQSIINFFFSLCVKYKKYVYLQNTKY